jgi:hypothetical protein
MISKGGFKTRPYETFVLFVPFVVKKNLTTLHTGELL